MFIFLNRGELKYIQSLVDHQMLIQTLSGPSFVYNFVLVNMLMTDLR